MFTELTLTEINEIDGGGPVIDFFKDVFQEIVVDTVVEGLKCAYKELSRPERYIGKPDYRTWLN
jgi:hypothetical protein